ncbi:hypothetical protein L218DRAFT_158805 [Marasmius fiardii PR-910]|nr:hypothetical protein L218DRAFT_158805 [Marasmius fiardii PR-910]
MQQQNYAPYYNQQGYYPNNPYYPQYQPQWPTAAHQTPFPFPQASQGNQQRYNHSQPPPLGSSMPLKSNLKRRETAPATTNGNNAELPTSQAPKQRKRTKSNPQKPPKETEATTQHHHQRSNSIPKAPPQIPDYPTQMFLSLSGSDEISIENISHQAMNEIRATIFSIWPHGMG